MRVSDAEGRTRREAEEGLRRDGSVASQVLDVGELQTLEKRRRIDDVLELLKVDGEGESEVAKLRDRGEGVVDRRFEEVASLTLFRGERISPATIRGRKQRRTLGGIK